MNIQNDQKLQNDLNMVFEKIQEIVEKSSDGDYIYRGEPEHYKEPRYCGKVSSSLWREYDIEAEHFDIEITQEEMLKEAQDYIHETNEEFEILTQLQHYGGKTNLIDFTTDYLVALFFACYGSHDKPGRVILLGESAQKANRVKKPRNIINRVRDQRSVFVRPPKGFIEPEQYKEINIPKSLKQPMLNYLEKYHDISAKTIYNDLHGFIRVQHLHKDAYTEFYKGVTCQEKKQHDTSIGHYTEALKLNPQLVDAYYNRGFAYDEEGKFDRAIKDYTKAIELNPSDDSAYNNRGRAYGKKGDYDRAIADYTKAIELKNDYAVAYYNRGFAYTKKGDYDRAIADYTKAIELKNDYAVAHNNRGFAYTKKGDYDRAIVDYTKAIELKNDYAVAYHNRGFAYGKKGDYDRAIVDYTKAIELKNDYAVAYHNRGLTKLHLQAWEEAKSDLTTARNMGMDIIATFRNDYESVSDFEGKHDIQLPADIAAMLSKNPVNPEIL